MKLCKLRDSELYLCIVQTSNEHFLFLWAEFPSVLFFVASRLLYIGYGGFVAAHNDIEQSDVFIKFFVIGNGVSLME